MSYLSYSAIGAPIARNYIFNTKYDKAPTKGKIGRLDG
jgi:hypothetical protein